MTLWNAKNVDLLLLHEDFATRAKPVNSYAWLGHCRKDSATAGYCSVIIPALNCAIQHLTQNVSIGSTLAGSISTS